MTMMMLKKNISSSYIGVTSAVVDETAWSWHFFCCVSPEGSAFVAKRKHVAQGVLRAVVIFDFALLVA